MVVRGWKVWLLAMFLLAVTSSAEENKFVVEDGIVTGVVGLEEGESLYFPDTVKAVDLTLDFEKLSAIRSTTSLEYCNLTLKNCKVNSIDVISGNTTLVAKGGSIASISLTGKAEDSIASVSCSGIKVLPVVKLDANDTTFSSDAEQVDAVYSKIVLNT